MNIGHDLIQAGLHDAHRATGQYHALEVQAAHQYFDPGIETAEYVLSRHFHIVEDQFAGIGATHAQLVQLRPAGKAFPVALDNECGDAMGALFRFGLGIDHIDVGIGAVGDPHLGAIEHIVVTALLGPQLHADHIGAGVGLAHGQCAYVLAANQLRQVLGLLFGRAVAVDLVDAQIRMRAIGQAYRCRGAADLFDSHHVGEVAKPGAAMLLRDGDAQQAEFAKSRPELIGELIVAVDGSGPRRDFGGAERVNLLTQHVDGFAQSEVQRGVMHVITCCSCSR